jgi:hypothetical protein
MLKRNFIIILDSGIDTGHPLPLGVSPNLTQKNGLLENHSEGNARRNA